jgi:hypothetical protein
MARLRFAINGLLQPAARPVLMRAGSGYPPPGTPRRYLRVMN